MDKNKKGIYAPGELSRVRDKLGVTDAGEAKKMAELLGGEVGTERDAELDLSKVNKTFKRKSKEGAKAEKRKPGRRVDTADSDESEKPVKQKLKYTELYPGDDPSESLALSYRERIKMDQYAGQLVFEIKSSFQVFTSLISLFKEPADFLNPRFVTKRMNEYYAKIERLVTSTRNIFPSKNIKRNNQLKRASPFVYKILDTLRNWDIEKIAGSLSKLQAHPRTVRANHFSDILREIYKPLFILEDLDTEDMKSAFKLLYKILYIESPMEAKEKYQNIIRIIIGSLVDIRRTVHFGLYPLLMKLISDRYIDYERFFVQRQRRFMAFLNVSESAQLKASDLSPQQIESLDLETLQQNMTEDGTGDGNAETAEDGSAAPGEREDLNDPKVIERKVRETAEKSERKALEQGRTVLETLFPKANWDKLEEYPDLYPYFSSVYSMRSGYELISPTDPLLQVSVLLNILDDLFIGLRYINFGIVTGSDGNPLKVFDELGDVLNNWRRYIEECFSKDYLPRLSEYCRMLENSKESRTSPYARRTLNELHWIKRLYFLPYYKFESIGPPPFSKGDIIPIYSLIRKIRKTLTAVAFGIEQGLHAGGAAAKAVCNGISNPWENYNFQIPNPVSKRLDMMLPSERRINATLVFYTLSVVSVLDHIINFENSWAYGSRPGPVFRSIRNEGIVPLFGVDEKLNVDQIFKESLKKK